MLTDAATGLALYALDGPGGSHATVVPALGGNCVRWQVAGRDILYAPPLAELAQRSTRGGIPILFPFPNRIRDGKFDWDGKNYQLECNDSTRQNAIHGFAARAAWVSNDADQSHYSAHFNIPDNWPTPGRITIRISLTEQSLRYEAIVMNTGPSPLPFGLGFHPYFAVSPGDRIQTAARGRWELDVGLPTGSILPVDWTFDLREPQRVETLTLDDVYTDFPAMTSDEHGLVERGRVHYADGRSLIVRASPQFRELVLFTPPHRKAVCLEPYTCPTDAVNLANRGLDVGWIALPPGETWTATVEYSVDS